MPEERKKYNHEFRERAVQIAEETREPIVQIARDPCVNEGHPGNWGVRARQERVSPRNCRRTTRNSRGCGWNVMLLRTRARSDARHGHPSDQAS